MPVPAPPGAPPVPTPAELERAVELRRLARELQNLRVLDLYRRAGPEVWVGPVAQQCLDQLTNYRRLILIEADGLLAAARRLEQGDPT